MSQKYLPKNNSSIKIKNKIKFSIGTSRSVEATSVTLKIVYKSFDYYFLVQCCMCRIVFQI